MTNAATGHALHGKGKGWRKAIRYAITENPVSHVSHESLSEMFQLAVEDMDSVPTDTQVKNKKKQRKTKEKASLF